MYGRYCYRLVVERFEKNTAREFLRRGFKELNVGIGEEELEEAINFFSMEFRDG